METEADHSNLLSRRRWKVASSAAAVFLTFVVSARSLEIDPISILGSKNPFLETAASRAVTLALVKLSHPGCRLVFEDFRDGSGRTLASRLEALGQDGGQFLNGLRFANGERFGPCQPHNVLAATEPNSHVIFLCGLHFFESVHKDPGFAADLVIHEMLHSLGLGENPPSSLDITSRVAARCDR